MTVEKSGAVDPPPALPGEIAEHVEWLAARVHDAWVRERQAAGWRHGPSRDDGRKEHPSLVSFQDLPEMERQLDRAVVIATLTGMLELGYRFEKR